ncbi:MAG: hypothetical protein ACFHWZ_07260 [Phycisphaerales bacterium]
MPNCASMRGGGVEGAIALVDREGADGDGGGGGLAQAELRALGVGDGGGDDFVEHGGRECPGDFEGFGEGDAGFGAVGEQARVHARRLDTDLNAVGAGRQAGDGAGLGAEVERVAESEGERAVGGGLAGEPGVDGAWAGLAQADVEAGAGIDAR